MGGGEISAEISMVKVGDFTRQEAPAHHPTFEEFARVILAVRVFVGCRVQVGDHVAFEPFEAPHEEEVGLDEDVESSGADHEVCGGKVHLEVLHNVANHNRSTPTDTHSAMHQHLPARQTTLLDKRHRPLNVWSDRVDPVIRHSLHVQYIDLPAGTFLPQRIHHIGLTAIREGRDETRGLRRRNQGRLAHRHHMSNPESFQHQCVGRVIQVSKVDKRQNPGGEVTIKARVVEPGML